MTPRIAEVRPTDASLAVRAIYDDIARATGIPQVNLIYRHLALEPAVLDWCWRAVGPLYRDGRVAAAAARLTATLPGPAAAPVWQGLEAEEVAGIRAVLAFYERGNGSNLIGLNVLLRMAAAEGAGSGSSPRSAVQAAEDRAPATPAAALPVPPLPSPETLSPDILALVTETAERQGTAGFGVLPSLYLHLALWPQAIRRAHAAVLPVVGTEAWDRALDGLIADAGALADGLARGAEAPPGRPPAEVLDGYLATVRRFAGTAIPQMLLVGRLLSSAGR